MSRGAYEHLLPAGPLAGCQEGRSWRLRGLEPVWEVVVSQPGTQAKRGPTSLRAPALTAIYRGTSPFPTRQLSSTGHVRASENGSFNVIKHKRGVIQGCGGSLQRFTRSLGGEEAPGPGRGWMWGGVGRVCGVRRRGRGRRGGAAGPAATPRGWGRGSPRSRGRRAAAGPAPAQRGPPLPRGPAALSPPASGAG